MAGGGEFLGSACLMSGNSLKLKLLGEPWSVISSTLIHPELSSESLLELEGWSVLFIDLLGLPLGLGLLPVCSVGLL